MKRIVTLKDLELINSRRDVSLSFDYIGKDKLKYFYNVLTELSMSGTTAG